MPDYRVTYEFVDELSGTTRKTFEGEFADYAAARAAADALRTDVEALTSAHVISETLSEVNVFAGAAGVGSNVFERIQATVNLDTAGKSASLTFPSPVGAAFAGNALDASAAVWTDFIDNLSAASGWEISDGEHVAGTVRGRRVFVRSGSTNLPS